MSKDVRVDLIDRSVNGETAKGWATCRIEVDRIRICGMAKHFRDLNMHIRQSIVSLV